ncbi:TetR/AcrR family transcriptional regulator [Azospirillum sp. RWY-5-1]|uniref:TetR/AcrR family transcriptional regulator n=1 Tax=Azospirillum oleiclasticum TaxID=2735135 RepID=A0ABX2TH10_9PROT|nr:TetR/AcrR family transcriptional regulator [Azospirillum oleiclasticum]NYZ17262.1 TetR/AcrR family transcriptional regulator [Azospirillum oleiclasticum]NYZ23454.1 TetR/AcrR family transcriptional regulator [Azospirillum oleiclasticum]
MTTKISGARGRPRTFDVDRAIETAMGLFHARGYDAVGVAELSEALGIKPPSFYAAFGNKAGLFERVLERYATGDANVFLHARAQGGSTAEVLERTLMRAAQLYPTRNGAAGCLVIDGTRNSADPDARALASAAQRAGRDAVRDFIAIEAPDRAEEIADFVVITLFGMSAAARNGVGEAALRSFAEAAGRTLRREFGLT